ncbi:MAG: alpha-amylase family glycosyl hydrolase [Elusimicrobiota bacterium]
MSETRTPTVSGAPLPLGARPLGNRRCFFGVWAPSCRTIEVRLVAPFEKTVPMERLEGGYFRAIVDNVEPGTRYLFRLDGERERPDPASRFQPEGLHGPSEVVADDFRWEDGFWCGLPLQDFVLYELHVGTFTPDGTLDAAIGQLRRLKDLGVTAVELMPVAQFPGGRNWGYDGVYPYAVQNTYGGPAALKRFVNECHKLGLAAVLDVVYNHVGPEGITWPSSAPISRTGTGRPGDRPSISTARIPTRCAGSTSRTPSPGPKSSISTPSAWTPSTRSRTSRPGPSSRKRPPPCMASHAAPTASSTSSPKRPSTTRASSGSPSSGGSASTLSGTTTFTTRSTPS